MKKINKFETEADWENWIGKPIQKHSNKPFKSGKKIGVPISYGLNPMSNNHAFNMDDGSTVDCYQCKLVVP